MNLTEKEFDLLVIGGGITGCGIALDAAARGLSVALVEMNDFAFGTSSRSTKLIHGGLRYLQQFEVALVREVGRERAIVYENGPHVTTPEQMMLPIYKDGTLGKLSSSIGLKLYDYLAGVKKKERRKMLGPEETIKREPLIKRKQLRGAGEYVEYKTDDARLTIEVLKKAIEHGAHVLNYVKVVRFMTNRHTNQIDGALVSDQLTNESFQIRAKKVINAAGPWVDEVRELDEQITGKHLQLTKGVHLVFAHETFPLKQAIYFDAFDGRMIFAIPRGRTTYVGTTDTLYKGDIARPIIRKEDVDYLLRVINDMFPTVQLKQDHIESSWAGVRPLIAEVGKKPGEISRKEEVFISRNGLISMAGGKLTGYRKMAEEAVDLVVEQLRKEEHILYPPSRTKHLPISGSIEGGHVAFQQYAQRSINEWRENGVDEDDASLLVQRYGTNSDELLRIYREIDSEIANERLVLAELVYAITYELACTPVDFFIRRTGDLYFHIDRVQQYKELVVKQMESIFNWSQDEKRSYENELNEAIEEAMLQRIYS